MSDIVIRDVAEATINEVDRRAKHQGLSCNEYLKRWRLAAGIVSRRSRT